MVSENEDEFVKAIKKDMCKRSEFDYKFTDLLVCKIEITHLIKHLNSYMKDKKVKAPIALITDSPYIHYSPIGNVLIISPWNFPINLTLIPLAGAIAAGCTAIIKPLKKQKYILFITI